MANKKEKFSFKKIFFLNNFFTSLVWKVDVNDKTLNWLSIVFLLTFDIFIFVNLASWLDNQASNIDKVYEKYSYNCSELFSIEKDFSSYNLNTINNNYSNNNTKNINAPFYNEEFKNNKKSDYCIFLDNQIIKIKNSSNFNNEYTKLQSLNKQLSNLESDKYKYERDYLEFREDYKSGLVNYEDRLSDIQNDSIREKYSQILSDIEKKNEEIKNIINTINNVSEVIVLKKYILENKQSFIEKKENYTFWYPVYVTIMEAILVIPIFIFTVLLYNFAIKRNLRILSILSSNLAFISWIFVFFILIKVIYWLLPKKFFANLITYLASIKALAIWNYILTIFWIIIFWTLMYFSQKSMEKYKKIKEEQQKQRELLDKERISKERFWKKTCIECNTKLLEWASHCSNCWTNQFKNCSNCSNELPRAYIYCEKCWEKN